MFLNLEISLKNMAPDSKMASRFSFQRNSNNLFSRPGSGSSIHTAAAANAVTVGHTTATAGNGGVSPPSDAVFFNALSVYAKP